MKRFQRNKAQEIQKEQFRLVKVENVLTKLLSKVNESINELKVEELHIKSCLIEQYTANHNEEAPSTSAQAALRLKSTTEEPPLNIQQPQNTIEMEGIEDINKQILALESLLVPIGKKKFNEQEEEEDEDDDYVPTGSSESDNEDEYEINARLKNKT